MATFQNIANVFPDSNFGNIAHVAGTYYLYFAIPSTSSTMWQPPGCQDPFRRIVADDQPYGQRAAFLELYPAGLPASYEMLQTPGPLGVQQQYVERYLPVGFYTNPPPDAKAIFSTLDGKREFRNVQHILPQRRVRLLSADEIQQVCNSFRQIYWHHMRPMQKPHCWDDLWLYFDAWDLYNFGILNLWNIINHLCDENRLIFEDAEQEFALEIGKWADDWLKDDENKSKLKNWDPSEVSVLTLLKSSDWETLGNLEDDVFPRIVKALKARRSVLLSSENHESARPKGAWLACQDNSLEEWLGKSIDHEESSLLLILHSR